MRKLLIVFAICLSSACICFALREKISVNEIEHGTCYVVYDGLSAEIIIRPEEGYALSKLVLRDDRGRKTALRKTANLKYEAELKRGGSYSLDLAFRTETLKLNKEQMGLRKGQSERLYAYLEYTDGEIKSRYSVLDRDLIFSSSNPEVASVDSKGNITALSKGYARISVSAAAAEDVKNFCYVLVDADKEPVIGKLTLVARFKPSDLTDFYFGHSFFIFESYVDNVEIKNVDRFYECYAMKPEYYKAIDEYKGFGFDPLTYYSVIGLEKPGRDNLAERKENERKYFYQYTPLESESYYINKGEIVSLGCTSNGTTEDIAGDCIYFGDSHRILQRNGMEEYIGLELSDLSKIDLRDFLSKAFNVAKELIYDFSTDYNPFTGHECLGGVSLNDELRCQASTLNTWCNACISIDITKTQLDAITDYAQYENNFNILGRNCTEYAVNAWNLATALRPELYLKANPGGITRAVSIPGYLQKDIVRKGIRRCFDQSIDVELLHPTFKAQKGLSSQY